MAHDVFISHSTSDKAVADAVCAGLENAGIRCWIAPRDVQPGRSFGGEIARAIKNSKAMVLIFSAHSNNSEQVLREVQLSVTAHLHIVQFRIEDVLLNDDLSYFLSTPHWLDALTPPLENHIDRLETALGVLLGTPVEPSVIAAAATGTQAAATAQRFGSASSSPPEKRDEPPNVLRKQEVLTAGKALRPPVNRGRRFVLAGAIVVLLTVGVFGGWWFGLEQPRENAERKLTEQSEELQRDTGATKERPYENSLGMKFVPVAGTGVLFSIWETRVKDYEVFQEAKNPDWPKPTLHQTDDHPAFNVSWEDATAFCEWLTEQERKAGRVSAKQSYRLPSDEEWSVAVGLKGESGSTPEARGMKVKGEYPWGTEWPPPKGAGNYGTSLKVDDHEYASPVGSFAENRFGLYDMGGNVWEWCQDWYDAGTVFRVLRGASWDYYHPDHLLSSYRHFRRPEYRSDDCGFRCVLAVESSR
jgi:formylglycine-generating enzyme required for sulfatase activity